MPFDLNEGFANFRDRDRLNEYPAPLMPLFESLERSGKASLLLGAFLFFLFVLVFVVWCVFASFVHLLARVLARRKSAASFLVALYIRASSPIFTTVVKIIAALLTTSVSSSSFSIYLYIYIYTFDVVIFFERRRGRVVVAREHEQDFVRAVGKPGRISIGVRVSAKTVRLRRRGRGCRRRRRK